MANIRKLFLAASLALAWGVISLPIQAEDAPITPTDPIIVEPEAESTADRAWSTIKEGASKTGQAIKSGSAKAADAVKSGAVKAGEATKRGYDKVKDYFSDDEVETQPPVEVYKESITEPAPTPAPVPTPTPKKDEPPLPELSDNI